MDKGMGFSLRSYLLDHRKMSPEDAKEQATAIYHRLLALNPRVSVRRYANLPLNPAMNG